MGLVWRGVDCKPVSFAPTGLQSFSRVDPRLTPWAAFLRRFAATTVMTAVRYIHPVTSTLLHPPRYIHPDSPLHQP
jgi:hypothetical protein